MENLGTTGELPESRITRLSGCRGGQVAPASEGCHCLPTSLCGSPGRACPTCPRLCAQGRCPGRSGGPCPSPRRPSPRRIAVSSLLRQVVLLRMVIGRPDGGAVGSLVSGKGMQHTLWVCQRFQPCSGRPGHLPHSSSLANRGCVDARDRASC